MLHWQMQIKEMRALASVAVQTVPLATDAGSALTSLGLTESDSDLTDVMYFHMDTTLTPNGERPMDGSSPNTGGETQSPNGNTLIIPFICDDCSDNSSPWKIQYHFDILF